MLDMNYFDILYSFECFFSRVSFRLLLFIMNKLWQIYLSSQLSLLLNWQFTSVRGPVTDTEKK